MQFQKNKSKNVSALLNFRSGINAINLVYAVELGLKVQRTYISALKIDKT